MMRTERHERNKNVWKQVYVNVRRKYRERCHHLYGNERRKETSIRKMKPSNSSMLCL